MGDGMRRSRWKRRYCLVAIAALHVAGCATRTVLLDGHRAFPAAPQFTITPRTYSPEELAAAGIRTDGVYVDIGWRPESLQALEDAKFREKGWKKGSPFYRFWTNGRVMNRLPHTEALSVEHADSFDRARVGYYRVVTNGTIETEFFLYDPGRASYTYSRKNRTIEGDTIWSDTGGKFRGTPVQLGYRFVPIKGMTAQPDW